MSFLILSFQSDCKACQDISEDPHRSNEHFAEGSHYSGKRGKSILRCKSKPLPPSGRSLSVQTVTNSKDQSRICSFDTIFSAQNQVSVWHWTTLPLPKVSVPRHLARATTHTQGLELSALPGVFESQVCSETPQPHPFSAEETGTGDTPPDSALFFFFKVNLENSAKNM